MRLDNQKKKKNVVYHENGIDHNEITVHPRGKM